MKTSTIGLTLAALLFLLISEPLVAVMIGVLVFALAGELADLRRQIAILEMGRQPALPAAEPAEAQAPMPQRAQPQPAPLSAQEQMSAMSAMGARAAASVVPITAAPKPGASATGAWFRWTSASVAELEELVAGRLLAVVGGIALFLGGIFFLGLAFSRGWIGPEMRVGIGLAAGVALFALGGWLLRGPRQIVAHVLVAVGLGVFSLALFAATRLYEFFPPEFGVGGALVAAAAAAALAVMFEAPIVAAFGLIAVLASPPLLGASSSTVTLAFIGAALAGTTAISIFRSWRWLPTIAFLLTVPQLGAYLLFDAPPAGLGLAAVTAFGILNAISAAGEEIRIRRHELSATSATLLVASAAVTVYFGFEVLDGELEAWRGLYLLGVAAAHFALAAVFLVRETDRHPFGMLAAGTGIAAVTLAVPIQLGAEWVPLAWAAEAVALAWIYAERRHLYSGVAAAILGILAAGHILAVEYLPRWDEVPAAGGVPFVNPNGMALGFVVVAAAVAVWILRARPERIAVAAVAVSLVAVAIPNELRGWPAALALTAIVTLSITVSRAVLRIPLRFGPEDPITGIPERALYATAAAAGLILTREVLLALPADEFVHRIGSTAIPSGIPFVNEASLVALIVAAGALAVALTCPGRWRPAGVVAAAGVVAYLLPFQVGAALTVAGWSVLAVGLLLGAQYLGDIVRNGSRALAAATGLLTLVLVASPDRLWVDASPMQALPVLNGAVLATFAVSAMVAVRAFLPPADDERRWAGYAACAVAVYGLSIAVVDLFRAQIGGPIVLEELQKQAQVALSVLWAVIGSVATVAGLRLNRVGLRLGGLVLLGIVTLKVFIVDLAALDIAYRVLSFVALGILLLVAAYLYSRMQPRAARTEGARDV